MNTNTNYQAMAARILRAAPDYSEPNAHSTTEAANRELVRAPDYVSVSGTIELLKMMLEISQTDRKAMKETQRSTEKAATAADESQVKSLRDQADSTFHAALVDGFMKIGCGAVTIAASELQIHGGALKDSVKDTTRGANDVTLARATELTNRGTRLKAGADLAAATSGPIAAAMNHGAAMHGIDATVDEQRSTALRRSSDSLKSDIDNVSQHDSKLFDMVREIEAAMNRCTQIALQSR